MLRRHMRALLGVCLLAAVALVGGGCDSKATTTGPDPQAAVKPEQKSREYESCGATMHCADNLRCLDQACRRAARSAVGDYYAAVGAAARARGDHEAAIAAYAQALGQYGAEKLEIPPDLDCAYGAALTGGRGKRETGELAARILHRCVLAVPPGSSLRAQAMASLAMLGEVGLDPLTLGGAKLADNYLTKGPAKPASDKVNVSVSSNPSTSSKSYAALSEKLADPTVKPALVACWEAYAAASKKEVLAVTLPIKVGYASSEYEDESGTWFTRIGAASGLSGPEAEADACVRKVVEPALKGQKLSDGFDTKVTITIK